MTQIVIEGGRVIDPETGINEPRDVWIAGDSIKEIARVGSFAKLDAKRISAVGCIVCPGLVDMHVHLREPGYEYKETILTGTEAAVAGGFTSVACMANTEPVNDNAAVTRYIREKASIANLARVFPIGALSRGLKGEELADIGGMIAEGAVAISDDGRPVMDASLMRRALEYCSMFDVPISVHEEDVNLSRGGSMNEGPTSLRLGIGGIPAAAEETMVARDIALARLTGGRVHVAHVSTVRAVELIRQAKTEGLPLTAEVAPHHFCLTEEQVEGYDTNAKMSPPLRSLRDVEAMKEGLRDGTIDAIATDHAPHHKDEKEVEFEQAAHGITGLETALPLTLSLVREGVITLREALAKLTANPARILGIPHGSLASGGFADVTLFDPDRVWIVDSAASHSLGRNTPFAGKELKGKVVMAIVGGRVVYETEEVKESCS